MFDLTGKVALITGATGAIGGEIVKTLHKMGATIAVSGTKIDVMEKMAADLSKRVHLFACNLSVTSAIEELVPNVERVCGSHIDILVNNAGIARDGLMMRMPDNDWYDVMQMNLETPFRLMRAVAKNMVKNRWGRIINISSIVGAVGNAGQSNYAASKSALFGLSKSTAAELATRNITVNCIAPGFIESPMTNVLSDQQKEILAKKIPMGRVGRPEEVAATVGFLATNEASYITGHVLHVNGGMVMI